MQMPVASFTATRAFCAQVQTFLDKAEVTDRVVACIKNFEWADASKVTAEANFKDDLGIDSLDLVETLMAVEDEFCIAIPDEEMEKIRTVTDVIQFISTHPQAK
eukprot:TRINITY_DN53704_c0_g1_i1.p2 TRINITY_DN53704_c0_g1~~TRINITY_DN53704_c0_g1_i1.p2  ORF type:complete len:117 (+),score=30.16 TRINITY_DN53704_c0_g1_i1:40-351(+)